MWQDGRVNRTVRLHGGSTCSTHYAIVVTSRVAHELEAERRGDIVCRPVVVDAAKGGGLVTALVVACDGAYVDVAGALLLVDLERELVV